MPETTVHAILAQIEQLPVDACGAFVVARDGASVGSVFVERNQVCWAAFAGLRRRLRDLLREHLSRAMDDAELDRTWARCASEGRKFGEELVSREIVKAEAMRRALKQHTIESLIALPQEQGEQIAWVAHRQQGYQPRFTFMPADLMIEVNAYLYASEAAGIEAALDGSEGELRAASYVPSDSGDLIAVRATGLLSTIGELDELGAWAGAAFGITRGFSPEVMRRAVETASGEMLLAWQSSRLHTHAAVIEDRELLEAMVANLARRSFPTVVSRRARSSLAVRGGLGTVVSTP
jgi:hypothetical protein